MPWTWFAALSIALSFLVLHAFWVRRRLNTRLPPGPKGLPIIGNVLDMPRKHLGREFAVLSAKYGTCVDLLAP